MWGAERAYHRAVTRASAPLRLIAAYLVAAVAETVVFFEWTGGHADVPLSMFPDYLVLAPLVPVGMLPGLAERPYALAWGSTVVFVVVLAGAWRVLRPRRRAAAASASEVGR